ncbi:hypothetical protein [Rhizobium sp. BK602]|nr:hypothetical protein [Rhizobium sp. BK602]MBB3612273.1 hypothetical protein [Rhizobium sp. BK602]
MAATPCFFNARRIRTHNGGLKFCSRFDLDIHTDFAMVPSRVP